MNLLAIDNCTDILDAISDYCLMNSINCQVVPHGIDGMFEIQKKNFDLIFLDIAMPNYTGFDILQQMKNQGMQDKNIVVITAANLNKTDFRDYEDSGIREVLHKPFELSQLEKVIKKYDTVNKDQF